MTVLNKLVFNGKKARDNYIDVDVPEFGEGAKIRIQKTTVAGEIRASRLYDVIRNATRISEDNRSALFSTVSLICSMVDEDGNYLEQGEDLESIKATLVGLESHGVFMRLFVACNKVNSAVIDNDTTKKNS